MEKKSGWLSAFIGVIFILPLALLMYFWIYGHLSLSPISVKTPTQEVFTEMSHEQKMEYYSYLAAQTPGSIWEAVPEPLVGRVLQFNIRKESLQAEIVSNNAGMRNSRPFGPKSPNTFRIICLGDSMVMGTAGNEEDRWGNQLDSLLQLHGITVDGKSIEVYSIGIGSWSSLNQVTYLLHRISAYQPDLVLSMMVENDLNDSPGVMGIQQATYSFSPENRRFGSGILYDHWPSNFGVFQKNLLASGIGPESQERWERAFAAWKKLELKLEEIGGKMLFGISKGSPLFVELCKLNHSKAGLKSPIIVTDYFGIRLPHDGHPNREGHGILATHYLHVLQKLNWLSIPTEALPALHKGLELATDCIPNPEEVNRLQKEQTDNLLVESIAFNHLETKEVLSILGGVYPGDESPKQSSYPYGSPRCGFLLRKSPNAKFLLLEIEVPELPELYPFSLQLFLNGTLSDVLELDSAAQAGRHILRFELPSGARRKKAIEVMLFTEAYWTSLEDFTMKSYRLISAKQL